LLSCLVVLLPACDRSRPRVDRNGDGSEGLAVIRTLSDWPFDFLWYFQDSPTAARFGTAVSDAVHSDSPVLGDYDGDHRIDPAVVRKLDCRSFMGGYWYWLVELSDGGSLNVPFGGCPTADPWPVDQPVPADYDGDGATDVAIFRPGVTAGAPSTWFVRLSKSGGYLTSAFGEGQDSPVPGDFDCDGRADLTVRRADALGNWQFISVGSKSHTVTSRAFGRSGTEATPGDTYVPGDVDGDGCADLTVVRDSGHDTLVWYSWGSKVGFRTIEWGNTDDTQVHGDFNGDGTDDLPAIARTVDGHFVLFARDGVTGAMITSPPIGEVALSDQLLNTQGGLPGF
jgi:hypothetical protein